MTSARKRHGFPIWSPFLCGIRECSQAEPNSVPDASRNAMCYMFQGYTEAPCSLLVSDCGLLF